MDSTEQPRDDDTRTARRRRSPLAVASVAVAVLAVAGGGALLAVGPGGPPDGSGQTARSVPAVGASTTGTDAAEPLPPGDPDPHGALYRATGTLPEGPASGHAYRGGPDITAGQVARLAAALGVPGTPRAAGPVWQVGAVPDGSGPLLKVARKAPGGWTFSRYAPGGDACARGADCGGGSPDPGTDRDGSGHAVSEAAAKRAAAPVLAAVGQQDAAVDASRLTGALRTVTADPVVHGLPTYGRATGLRIGADGRVAGGTGDLGVPAAGPAYPTVGARDALDTLNRTAAAAPPVLGCATPEPLTGAAGDVPGSGIVGPTGGPACAPATPARQRAVPVDGAVFGLAARTVDGQRGLVPSWLFTAHPGGGAPSYVVAADAVAPGHLEPAPPRGVQPGRPTSVGPGAAGRADMSYSVRGRELTVAFTAGVCGTYPLRADESAAKVTVRIGAPVHTGAACVAMARVRHATVALDRPLGGRSVVTAEGDVLPRA